ncbi:MULTISPECIES: hypothetical protein [unclassified Microbacterium]|uniref:hypothetical protein n=1 Tax=unclassified Microbacterium TaxID=2609290 RepID=UPI00055EF872|nr:MULTISPECIES: hypothetical protein [unclassified Microbacterium]
MPALRRSRARRSLPFLGATAALGVIIASGASTATAAPGSPGVMGAPTVVLYEGFEGPVPPATPEFVQTIADYDDGIAPPVPGYVGRNGKLYRADPAWNGQFCNGLIVAGDDVSTLPTASQAADCQQSGWNQSRGLAETLGAWASDPEYPYPAVPRPEPGANHAVSSYTQGDSPAGVMAATVVPVTVGHYYTATIDVAQANCWTTNPVNLALRLDDGASAPVDAFPGPIAACDLPVHQINGNNVGTFSGLTSLLARSTSMEVALLNTLGGGGGDDNAFDNLALIDTTPQLDAVIAAPPSGDHYAADQPARLLLTVTNTHLAGSPIVPSGAKPEWSFDLALPAGLVPAESPAIETDCPNGALDVTSASIVGRGSLGPTDVSCSLALDLVSSGGEYVLDPTAYELTGLLAPAATSVGFAAAPATPDPSPTGGPVLADSGSEPLPALLAGVLAATLGAALIHLSSAARRRRTR